MREAIERRISRRTFEKEPIGIEMCKQIEAWIDRINEQSGLTIQFIEDGGAAFQSFRKSYGMFKNVRSVILMKGKNDDADLKDDTDLKEKIGYYGEELVLGITDLGLGTCWVAGSYDKNVFAIDNDREELVCVIPVGVIEATTFKEKAMRTVIRRKVKSIKERVTSDGDLPQWAIDGMEAVLRAPSAANSQKARFIFKDHQMYAEIANNAKCDMVDLGIAKKHFEIEAGGTFELGNGSRFKREEREYQSDLASAAR